MKRLIVCVILLSSVTIAQDKPSPIPQPDALTEQDQQIAYMNKYITKLQAKILEMQRQIDERDAKIAQLEKQTLKN